MARTAGESQRYERGHDSQAGNAVNRTSEQIKTWIDLLVTEVTFHFDDEVIDDTIKGLRVDMSIAARLIEYMNELFKQLNAHGFGEYKKKNPKKTIELLCKNLYPTELRDKMKRNLDYDDALKENVRAFVNKLCNETRACQSYINSGKSTKSTSKETSKDKGTSYTSKSTNSLSKAPLCWWKPHADKGIRHKLVDCNECPEEEKKRIFEEKRKARN